MAKLTELLERLDSHMGKADVADLLRDCRLAATALAAQEADIAEKRDALIEAEAQIIYLHDKFQETGSGNTVLARIRAALQDGQAE